MPTIVQDPDFKAVDRALSEEEYAALRDKIRAEGAREPLWLGSGPLANTLLDGYNRIGIYDELQIFEYPTTRAPVETREDAVNWIIEHQMSRRNLNREERTYLIGKRYLRDKAQGRKGGDGKTTAERMGAGEALGEKTVRRAAEYTKAVDAIAENVGPKAAQEIRQGKAKMSAETVVEVAKAPPAQQPKAYAAAKGTKSKPGKARTIRTPKHDKDGGEYVLRTGARSSGPNLIEALGHVVAFTPASARQWIADHPDETRKARSLAASVVKVLKAIEATKEPRERFAEATAALEDVLRADGIEAVMKIAKEVLGPQAEPEPAPEAVAALKDVLNDCLEDVIQDALEAAPEPVASPSVARDDQDAIRQRLRDRMGSTGLAGLAREIDIGAQTLKNFLAGGTLYAKTLARITAYLGR